MISDQEVEKYVVENNLTAPRVTLDMILDYIDSESYTRIDGTNIMLCILKMKNGFTFTGEAACVSDENYDENLGKKIAKQNAVDKCWCPFGFFLATILSGVMPNG